MLLRAFFTALAISAPIAASAVTAPAPDFEATGDSIYSGDLTGTFLGDFLDTDGDAIDISAFLEIDGGVATGELFVSDFATGILLQSTTLLSLSSDITDPLADGTPTPDSVTLVFGGLSGASAMQGGATATAVFSFFLEDDDAGFIDPVTARVFVAPIPLPAGLPLLALGIGALGLAARRRAAG